MVRDNGGVPQEYPIVLRGFPGTVTRVDDVVYSAPGGRPLLADLYLPVEAARPVPVIIFLHAGGWRGGDRRFGPDLGRFYTERGFAMVSVEYRLSGEAVFPAAVHDVKAAIRWVRSAAEVYGFDPARIGLWGLSAGGHLAALAALSGPGDFVGPDDAHRGYASDVRAVVSAYGPVDFGQMDSQRESVQGPFQDSAAYQRPTGKLAAHPDSYESRFLGSSIGDVPELVRRANPAAYIKGPGAPPMLLAHGLEDTAVPPGQSELLFDALGVSGNNVTLCLIEDLGHGFMNRNDFDQGIFRRVKKYECRDGEAPVITEAPPFTFGTVETFFRRWL